MLLWAAAYRQRRYTLKKKSKMVKNNLTKRPCKICGSKSFSTLVHLCKRCFNINKKMDTFIEEDIESATDFLLEKISKVTKQKLAIKQYNYIKKLNLKPYVLPEPIKSSPNFLRATIISTTVINRLTNKFSRSGTHINLLDDLDFQRLHRNSGFLLCTANVISNMYNSNSELTCKRCIKMAKSLERRGIEIIYLDENEISDYSDSKRK